MRKFKTADKNRTNYVYYTEEGKKIVLTPEDVDSTWIALLHDEDDEFVDADRRENYHVPVHYDSYSDGEGEDAADRNDYLKDDSLNPFEQLIQSMDAAEHEDKLQKLKSRLYSHSSKNSSKRCFMTAAPTWILQQRKVSPKPPFVIV